MRVRIGAPLLGAALALLLAPAAQATTFCVPGFSAACQQGGGRIAEPSLDTALKANGQDGVPDRIVIAPGTVTTIVGTPDNPSSPAIRAIVPERAGQRLDQPRRPRHDCRRLRAERAPVRGAGRSGDR